MSISTRSITIRTISGLFVVREAARAYMEICRYDGQHLMDTMQKRGHHRLFEEKHVPELVGHKLALTTSTDQEQMNASDERVTASGMTQRCVQSYSTEQ